MKDLSLQKIREWFTPAHLQGVFGALWKRVARPLFFLAFVGIVAWGGWFWNRTVNGGTQWTDEEKQEFLLLQQKRREFKEDRFDNVVGEIEDREKRFNASPQERKDIFYP